VNDGSWIAEHPDRREAGFWVSGLLSPFCDLEDAMYRYEHNDKMAEFMRSILGIATTDASCQLTNQAVRDCVGTEVMRMTSPVETVMGVDIGKKLHATIGFKSERKQYIVLCVKELDSYQELHDLAKKMKVRTTVMDSGPYDHGARDYQKNHPGTYLCYYSESQPGEPRWDNKAKSVKVNRNEWCDSVYETFMDGRIEIPVLNHVVKEYARQLTCTEKTEIQNEAGLTKPRWVKRGDDHYFHSTLYFLLAAQRSSVKRLNQDDKPKIKKTKNSFRI
jgi:hypothetical protein